MTGDAAKKDFPALLDEQGNLPIELLDKDAQEWAGKISNKQISTHQVRRFFDEVKKYKQLLNAKIKTYPEIRPLIFMIKSKARYAVAKKRELRPFSNFLEQAIDEIKKGDDEQQRKRFMHFCLFFEAVYGFADLKNK